MHKHWNLQNTCSHTACIHHPFMAVPPPIAQVSPCSISAQGIFAPIKPPQHTLCNALANAESLQWCREDSWPPWETAMKDAWGAFWPNIGCSAADASLLIWTIPKRKETVICTVSESSEPLFHSPSNRLEMKSVASFICMLLNINRHNLSCNLQHPNSSHSFAWKNYSKTLSVFTIWKNGKSDFSVCCFSHSNKMWQVLRGIHCKSGACGGKASNEQSKHEVIVGMITRAWPLKPSVPPSIRGIMVPRPAAMMNFFLTTQRIVWGTICKITWNTS